MTLPEETIEESPIIKPSPKIPEKMIEDMVSLVHASHRLPQDSNSYFLPFPESSHVSRAIGLHFVEITRLHEPLEPIPFATYFWYTLWHLLGIHGNFFYAY